MTVIISPVALLGTSADPPTYGHQALLQGLCTLFPKVITWASDNPMKAHYASLSQRYNLLHTLVINLAIKNLELKQELSSPKTINTINKAMQIWPGADLIFVIGSDLIGQIPSWSQSKDLLKKTRIGIAPREGWPLNKNDLHKLEEMGARIDLLPLKVPATASSQIRNKSQTSQIPPAILPLIQKEKLYGL